MRKFPRTLIVSLVLALGLTSDTLAATRCAVEETPEQCFARLMDQLAPADVNAQLSDQNKQEESAQNADLLAKPTGIDTGGVNLGSTTKNFLPLLALSGLLGDAKQSGKEGTYVFDLNFLVPGLAKDKNAQLQAVVDSQPVVSEALKAQLPAASRDATAKKLADGLGDLDDYTLSFTYNWVDKSHGRGFNQYRNRFQSLAHAVSRPFLVPPTAADKLRMLGDAVGKIEKDLRSRHVTIPEGGLLSTTFDDITRLVDPPDPDIARQVEQATEEAAIGEADRLNRHRQALAKAGLGHFADLLDNQPQLHLSVQRRSLDPVVGGDETSAKLTYEWSLASFNNAMSSDCHRQLDNPDPRTVAAATLDGCLAQYTSFVDASLATLKTGTRLSFAVEYDDISKDTIDRPQDGVAGVTLPGAKKLIISAGWSRHFVADPNGGQPMRLDLVAKYENVSNDPTRQDRGVATLTITRQFGNLTIPFGVVYANHGEFLGQVDKQLSAHVGLKFNLFGAIPAATAKPAP